MDDPRAANPYAPPVAPIPRYLPPSQVAAPENAEEIRREHLGVEASLKAFGVFLVGVALVVFLAILFDLASGADFLPGSQNGPAVGLLIFLVLVALPLFLGVLFLKVAPVARMFAALIATPGLLFYPAGTVIAGLLLYRMFSKKGNVVFSPVYRTIIAATPHIRSRSRTSAWFLAQLLTLPWLIQAFADF